MNRRINIRAKSNVAIIVAHPDDETLWCGGTILLNPDCHWFILSLCRKNDPDRAPRFKKALTIYKARGCMGDLDDSPEQLPVPIRQVKDNILELLPEKKFDLLITHNPSGEYTRHRRHEEISKAVIELWHAKKIFTEELWTFAYEDGNKAYFPKKQDDASIHIPLPKAIFERKYKLITQTYGFLPSSFEAQTTPDEEAFWKFETSVDAFKWLKQEGMLT